MGVQTYNFRYLMNIEAETQDLPIKNSPFAFSPPELAKLQDPKNLNVLREMVGVRGLVMGLRTNSNKGLSPLESTFHRATTVQDVIAALEQQESTRNAGGEEDLHETQKRVSLVTSSSSKVNHRTMSGLRKTFSIRSHPVTPPFEDRRRVFGVNRIPPRLPKTLLQLMWSVLQDQVLVRHFICNHLIRFYYASLRSSHLRWDSIRVFVRGQPIRSSGSKVLPFLLPLSLSQ